MDEATVKSGTGEKQETPKKKGFLAKWFPWLVGLGLLGTIIAAAIILVILAIFVFIIILFAIFFLPYLGFIMHP